VDELAYASEPYGETDPRRTPISSWLNGDNATHFGQARVVANPRYFMNDQYVQMHVASSDPAFHAKRVRFQEELIALFRQILGGPEIRERAATRIYGGVLPAGWRDHR